MMGLGEATRAVGILMGTRVLAGTRRTSSVSSDRAYMKGAVTATASTHHHTASRVVAFHASCEVTLRIKQTKRITATVTGILLTMAVRARCVTSFPRFVCVAAPI